MDIKEYIASGIIERYVFDSVSSQEKREVECMSHIYPEIAEEVKKLQSVFEKIALKTAEQPSVKVKASIFEKIKKIEQEKVEKETKIVQLNTKNKTNHNYFNVAASAAMVVLIISFYIGNSLLNTKQELAKVNNTTKELNGKLDALSQKTNQYKEHLAFLQDINTSMVAMNGTEKHPGMLANVYWNKESHKVMLDVKVLPNNPTDKQYQLWAIIDGQPVDMGVFDTNNSSLISMKTAKYAQAFAVTLEPKGGSKSPTLEEMYVIGNT
ncbi:anti-sigma factor [Crocinitomicaceae bacterium]|nr:anti-sigma factor [Crocinitomicaceae bacterium]